MTRTLASSGWPPPGVQPGGLSFARTSQSPFGATVKRSQVHQERTVRPVDESMPPLLVLEMPKDQPACRPPHEGDVHMPSETAPIHAA